MAGVVLRLVLLDGGPWNVELRRRRMPAHRSGVCGSKIVFLDSLFPSKTHHHVVVVIERCVQLGSRRGLSPLNSTGAIVVAPGLLDAVCVAACLTAVAP
jgi:hypothetical protein